MVRTCTDKTATGEKRKRKLQQLQQLLNDEESNEEQGQIRSESPYGDWSCSSSVGHRSVASLSPHIPALTEHFSSPQIENLAIPHRTWSSSDTLQVSSYSHPHPISNQQTTACYAKPPSTTTQSAWGIDPMTAHIAYPTTEAPYQSLHPSYASLWSSPVPEHIFGHMGDQQQTASSPYTFSHQYYSHNDSSVGAITDQYGRRFRAYEP